MTDTWLCEYDEKDVTPPGLRCRNLLSFPPNPEIKVPGSKFGANFGRGLHFDIKPQHKVNNPQLTIAKRMEYRQLIEYQKLSDEIKGNLTTGLKNYMKFISDRAENHRMLLTHDPRSEIEKQTAIKILQLARPDNLSKCDIRIMYQDSLQNSKNKMQNIGKNMHIINKLIIKTNGNKSEAIAEELKKEKINKEAWKTTFVPAYFDSQWGKMFLENSDNAFKDANFLQTSENYFHSPEQVLQKKDEIPMKQEIIKPKNNIIKSTLPPISNQKTFTENSSVDKKENLVASIQNFYERYQPKFKHMDKLNPKKLPNSIKTNRSNALPNSRVSTKSY